MPIANGIPLYFFHGIRRLCCRKAFPDPNYVPDAYGAKTDGQFVNHLMDVIRERGAMEKLISDKAQSQISNATKDILRHLVIEQWTSEPHHQNQNPFERQYATLKRMVNNIMNRTGAPA